jgi:mediator of RNA polymerase II transcription subunit 7
MQDAEHLAYNMQIKGGQPPLAEENETQLYPSSPKDEQETASVKTKEGWSLDRARYLKEIVRSILLNYLELIGIMSEDPTCANIKLAHFWTLFMNAHHIINEYRPHQAREALIQSMEERIAKMKGEIEAVKVMKAKIEGLPASLPTAVEAEEEVLEKKDGEVEVRHVGEDDTLAELLDEFGV